VFRGVAERSWCHENPSGSKRKFGEYFKGLTSEQLQVCRTRADSGPTKTAPQKFERQAEAEVVPTSPISQMY
jgi:hypothetical protein